jgi:predicted nucleotidyltransferase
MITEQTLQQVVEQIIPFGPEKIILFGSYASGTSNASSDLDLLVIKNIDESQIRPERLAIRRSLFPILFKEKIELDLLVDNEGHILKRISLGDQFYKEITTKGKILYAK